MKSAISLPGSSLSSAGLFRGRPGPFFGSSEFFLALPFFGPPEFFLAPPRFFLEKRTSLAASFFLRRVRILQLYCLHIYSSNSGHSRLVIFQTQLWYLLVIKIQKALSNCDSLHNNVNEHLMAIIINWITYIQRVPKLLYCNITAR